jgi:hypothetical protein
MTKHAIWLAAATTILTFGASPGSAQQQTIAVFTKDLTRNNRFMAAAGLV